MHFQHSRDAFLFATCFVSLLTCFAMCVCVTMWDCLSGERICQLGQPFNVQQQLNCLGAEQSLIHNHRCIFTAAQERSPTASIVLCTCNYANLSTPLVYAALLLLCLLLVSLDCIIRRADAQRRCQVVWCCAAAAAHTYTATTIVFLMFALQPAAKFSLSRAQWHNFRWLSPGGCGIIFLLESSSMNYQGNKFFTDWLLWFLQLIHNMFKNCKQYLYWRLKLRISFQR